MMGLLLVAACSGSSNGDSATATDSALSRDIALASRVPETGALGDTALSVPAAATPTEPAPVAAVAPPRPATRTPRPSPTTAPAPVVEPVVPTAATPEPTPAAAPAPTAEPTASGPAPSSRSLGAGTAFTATTTSRVCSRTNRPGDKLVGTLREPLTVSDGSTIPAGTSVVFEVAEASPNGQVTLRVRAIAVQGSSVPLEGTTVAEGATEQARVPNGDDKGKVVRGAIIGAIAGRILGGGSKGAVIGAAGGAAVGTAQAMKGAGSETCLSPGASVRVTLASNTVLP
jgi:hypothetical protein